MIYFFLRAVSCSSVSFYENPLSLKTLALNAKGKAIEIDDKYDFMMAESIMRFLQSK